MPALQTQLLLQASALVFLFRAMAASRTAGRREEVAQQLLNLLREFVQFDSGRIILGRTDDDLASQCDDVRLWNDLTEHGPVLTNGAVAVPIYAKGALAGALILDGVMPEAMDTLSAIASLASVSVESMREVESLREACAALERRLSDNGGILGSSAAVTRMLGIIGKLAARDTTVLIQGESGTGKELVARLLHSGSPRASAPFIAINCAAIAESLLESELFGYEKGAFTGAVSQKKGRIEAAHLGTLFLDEIGELPAPMQAKLLRVLQERELERVGGTRPIQIDIRVLAATNRDLSQLVREGMFREDLFHRLNVVGLKTPPLRERIDDIPELSTHFLRMFVQQCRRPPMSFSASALHCLRSYSWPGNIRELRNAVEHAVVLADGTVIEPGDLPDAVREAVPAAELGAFYSSVADAKRDSIVRAYQQAGDYRGAAQLLGLHPNYLLRLVRNLGLKETLARQSLSR